MTTNSSIKGNPAPPAPWLTASTTPCTADETWRVNWSRMAGSTCCAVSTAACAAL